MKLNWNSAKDYWRLLFPDPTHLPCLRSRLVTRAGCSYLCDQMFCHVIKNFEQQISWHECIARLLVRRPITASGYSGVKPMVPDLIDLDGDLVPALTPRQALTPLSPSKMWPSPGLNASAMNLGLGLSLEQDLKVAKLEWLMNIKYDKLTLLSFRMWQRVSKTW